MGCVCDGKRGQSKSLFSYRRLQSTDTVSLHQVVAGVKVCRSAAGLWTQKAWALKAQQGYSCNAWGVFLEGPKTQSSTPKP